MGWKITLTFADAQSSLLHFRRYYPRRLPMAAIFLLRDANCRRWNRRIPCQPFCLKYVLIHSLGKFTTLETEFPAFCSHKRETLAIIQGREINRKTIKSVVDAQAERGRLSRGGVWVTCNCWGRGKLIFWPSEFPTIIRGVHLRRVQGRRSIWFIHLNIYLVIYFIIYCFWERVGARMPPKPSSGFLMNSSSFRGKLQDDLGAIPKSFFVETTRALFQGHGNTGPWWYYQSYRSNMLPFFKFKHEKTKQNKQTKLRERVCERQSSMAFDSFFDSATIWNISGQITDQLETRSNVSSVFWLVERPVKRQQVTRLFFKAKAELFYNFCWVLQRNFSKVCRHNFSIFAHLGFPFQVFLLWRGKPSICKASYGCFSLFIKENAAFKLGRIPTSRMNSQERLKG